MRDTTPEITEKMCEMIRAKSSTERLKMGCSMYDTSKSLVVRAILEENPGISNTAFRRELFLKFYRDDVDPVTREKIIKHLEDGKGFKN